MTEPIDITRNEPHVVSEVICVKCIHRWIAVRQKDVMLKHIYCSTCAPGYVIETGEVIQDNLIKLTIRK
jgi:hypothetical protein